MPSNLQGLSFLVAMILKAIGPHPSYDSDDDYASDRAPLLKDDVHPPPYVVGNPVMGSRNNAWSVRVTEKRSPHDVAGVVKQFPEELETDVLAQQPYLID
ncbi:hypothetical protein POTOM_045800 [Populus tomentosa]|uniref:Uncharacterized protein n=1 Tax=Populus tomentosa TaxID=118781 RepID=A0A8X7YJN8_POPTO|nr:hypothetical protein POTOM_045800 [Populus tomentosa]